MPCGIPPLSIADGSRKGKLRLHSARLHFPQAKLNEKVPYRVPAISCHKVTAVSFHFPKDFRVCWVNTFKPKLQKEWDEAYRLGVVTTSQQDILILEDEASNTLAGTIDWVREVVPTQFTPDELSTLETLARS